MENRITTGDSYRFSAFLVSYKCLRISHLRIPLVESMSKPLRKSGRSCAHLSPCNGVQYVNSGDLVLDFRTKIWLCLVISMATRKIQTSEKRRWARKITRAKEGTLSDPKQVVGRGRSNAKSIAVRELWSTDTLLNIMYWCRRPTLSRHKLRQQCPILLNVLHLDILEHALDILGFPHRTYGGIKRNIRLPLKLRKAFFLRNYDGWLLSNEGCSFCSKVYCEICNYYGGWTMYC